MHALLLSLFLVATPTTDGGTPADAGVSDQFPKAADGTPMVLPDGDANPAYYNPPKTYRSPEGFQAARWGMSRAEVKKAFPKAKKAGNDLHMVSTVAGLKANIYFWFAQDRLAVVFLDLEPEGPEAGDFHDSFAQVLRGLQDKYGDPAYDKDEWKNDLFKKGSTSEFGMALALGHVVPNVVWQGGESEIALRTDVAELHRTITVKYSSRRLSDLWQAELEARSKAESNKNAADL